MAARPNDRPGCERRREVSEGPLDLERSLGSARRPEPGERRPHCQSPEAPDPRNLEPAHVPVAESEGDARRPDKGERGPTPGGRPVAAVVTCEQAREERAEQERGYGCEARPRPRAH